MVRYVAVYFLVLAVDDGEGVHDVGHGVAGGREVALEFGEFLRGLVAHGAFGDAGGFPLAVGGGRQVEVEEGGVQLAAEQEAALLVPAERRAGPAAVLRERLQVPRRVGQFQHAGQEPVAEGLRTTASMAWVSIRRVEDWELVQE